jgi:hypothetical protein
MAKKASPIQLSHNLAWESNPDGTSQRVVLDCPDVAAEIDRRLGLFEDGDNDSKAEHEQRVKDGVSLISAVWDFCFENGKGKFMDIKSPWHLQIVLRRFIVLTMMFRAKRLPQHTLRSIAKLLPQDVNEAFKPLSRVPVSKIGLEAVKRFNFQSRVQKPAASIVNYQNAAKRGHKTRKDRANARAEKAHKEALRLKRAEARKRSKLNKQSNGTKP